MDGTRYVMYRTTSTLLGTVAGAVVGGVSYVGLVPNRLAAVSLAVLYAVGVSLLIDHVRVLRSTGDRGGSWWVIAFGGLIGTTLIVLQAVYTPVDVRAVGPIAIPAAHVAQLSVEFTVLLYLFVFAVALVSLNMGLGLAFADLHTE